MKKNQFLTAVLGFFVAFCAQQTQAQTFDSTQFETIENVILKVNFKLYNISLGATDLIQSQTLQQKNLGQDIPMILQHQTGVISTSDAGNGIGYTGIRVRGSDATRTQVNINGVPINDAESQGTFWVNMPDLVSSSSSISIQRGVGSSVFGAGAFGGGVYIQTDAPTHEQRTSFDLSYGSFNTRKITAKWNSKNIALNQNRRLKINARVSNIASDGFIDRASTSMSGYLFSAQLYHKNLYRWRLKLLAFGGRERTYQAWWGIPIEKFNLGNPKNTETSEQPLIDHYYRNVPYTYRNAQDSLNLFQSSPNKYNYYTYPGETDNYQQHHFHLYADKNFSNGTKFIATTYYTYGTGYFEQYRLNDELSYYGLPNFKKDTQTLTSSPLVRQRWLQNHLIGTQLNLFTEVMKTELHFGLGGSQYLGQHFGRVTEVMDHQNQLNNELPKEYYRSSGNKTDISAFVKAKKNLSKQFSVFADLQYRYVKHIGKGNDNDLLSINFDQTFHFFNPKGGAHYKLKNHEFTLSAAVSNREPARSDFTDNKSQEIPKSERLIDYEFQHAFVKKHTQLITNFYYMDYNNQLVLTGAVNDVGTSLRKNVDRSFRRGIEITWNQLLLKSNQHTLNFNANLALSQNKIKQFTASWLDYATYEAVDSQFFNTDIAYSPNQVGALGIQYSYKENFSLQILQKFVGRQFLDNTSDISRSLDAYTFTEMFANYSHQFKNGDVLNFKLQVSNALNNYFANNGYTWGYMYGSRDVIQEVFVFPTAIRNATFSVGYQF